jgi:hypothetical protein
MLFVSGNGSKDTRLELGFTDGHPVIIHIAYIDWLEALARNIDFRRLAITVVFGLDDSARVAFPVKIA